MRKPLLFLLPALVVLARVPVRASTVQYNLTLDQCTGSCGPANTIFGTITLSDSVANTVNVNVTLDSPYLFIHTGFPVTVAWNLSGEPAIVANNLPENWTLLSSSAGSLHMTSKDYFEYGVSCCGNQNGASNAMPGGLNFSLTGSGLSTSSFDATQSGHFFAVDILNADRVGAGAGNTGVVEALGGYQVQIQDTPEPGTLALLCCGFVALGWMLRRKRRNPESGRG